MTDGNQPTQPSNGEGPEPTPPSEGVQPAKSSGATEAGKNPPATPDTSKPISPAPPSPTQKPESTPALSNEEQALADAEPTISMPSSPAQQTPGTTGSQHAQQPGAPGGGGVSPTFGTQGQQPPTGMPGGPIGQGPGPFTGQSPVGGPPQASPAQGPPGQFGQPASGSSKNKKVALIAGIIGVVVLLACGIGGYFLYQNISTDNAHQKGKCIVKDGDKAESADCDDEGALKISKRVNDTTDPEKCPAKDTEEVFINETNDYILCLKKP